jgi:hypothetical protein
MTSILIRFARVLLCLGSYSLAQADVKTLVQAKEGPNGVQSGIILVAANWLDQIPPSPRVNAPEFLQNPYPGQKVAFALIVEGPDRNHLLDGAELQVRFSSAARGTIEERHVKLRATKQIKAEGADMALGALRAAKIAPADQAAVEKATSMVNLAIFQPEWAVPETASTDDFEVTATISGGPAGTKLDPLHFKVRPTADWLNDPAPSMEEVGKFANRYHQDLPPGRFLAMLKTASAGGQLNNPSMAGFFVFACRENLVLRKAVTAAFPSLDAQTQFAVLFVLRLGGQDITALAKSLPAETTASLKEVAPLKDPRDLASFKDPVDVEEVRHVGVVMDQCWAGWTTTGDQSYLRALVGLLDGADDYPALKNFMETKPGLKGLNAAVGRGLEYQIAGWSIFSFQRTDPLVADWLLYWQDDPGFPAVLRREIASLATNPAFKRH